MVERSRSECHLCKSLRRMRKIAALAVLLLPISGCRESVETSDMGMSFVHRGRRVELESLGPSIRWLVACDREMRRAEGSSGSWTDEDGATVSWHMEGTDTFVIDGTRYALADGRVFLCRIDPKGNKTQQVPYTFPDAPKPYATSEDSTKQIIAALDKAIDANEELSAFFREDEQPAYSEP